MVAEVSEGAERLIAQVYQKYGVDGDTFMIFLTDDAKIREKFDVKKHPELISVVSRRPVPVLSLIYRKNEALSQHLSMCSAEN